MPAQSTPAPDADVAPLLAIAQRQFAQAAEVQAAFATPASLALVAQAGRLMALAIRAGGKILSCGNGGSMCDAMHFAEELSGRYRTDRPAVAAMSLSDPSHITCVGNDYGFEFIFARMLEAIGKPGDILLALSTSGNSANVCRAAESAHARGMQVVGLTGKDGGKLAPLCTLEIRVPHQGYADRVQEVHIQVIHTLMGIIEHELFGIAG
jgi:D-sedoheptulose 7-phosphate isomerase